MKIRSPHLSGLISKRLCVYLYPKEITLSSVRLKGSISYLKEAGFILPERSLRVRERDVFSPEALLKKNLQYRNRYIYGACWRADIITAIQQGMKSPSEVMKKIQCSYEPAYRVFKKYRLGAHQGIS
ncbi:MAG: hypothetical protein HY843_07775 [Bdellovibrio sp.]|nr:hypothetical protein [Bdellovibrio sp.]